MSLGKRGLHFKVADFIANMAKTELAILAFLFCVKFVKNLFANKRLIQYLPPATEVCESYLFTRVCHSIHRWGDLQDCMLGYTSPRTRDR